MASCSNYSLLLISSPSSSMIHSRRQPPVLSSMIHSRRQPPVVLKEKSTGGGGFLGFSDFKQQKGFGCSIHLLQRNSWFGSIRRRCNKGWGSEGEGDFALETEILKFMDFSENPNKFPTKKDLINAGREDLVEAIEKNGDWLSKGWDLDKKEEVKVGGMVQENEIMELNSGVVEEDLGSGFLHSDDRIFQERCFNGGKCDSLEEVDVGIIASEDSSYSSSTSGREMEKVVESVEEDDSGINGILKRLEKERNLSFGFGSREKETADLSCKNDYYDDELKLGSSMFSDSKPATTTSLKPSNDSYIVSEATDFGKGSISDFDLGDSLKPGTWRAWSSQRQGLSQLDFEASEIGLDVATDNIVVQKNVNETEEERSSYDSYSQTGGNWFRSRVQHLESELASTLRSLKSASEIDISSPKGSDNPSDEFFELSDAWEFKETEVMNAKNKLRSIHAKLAILEGKVALAAIESHKNLEMKQKRINVARLGLNTLRNACIVWPNNKALEVLVCGSFDGWTSQGSDNPSEISVMAASSLFLPSSRFLSAKQFSVMKCSIQSPSFQSRSSIPVVLSMKKNNLRGLQCFCIGGSGGGADSSSCTSPPSSSEESSSSVLSRVGDSPPDKGDSQKPKLGRDLTKEILPVSKTWLGHYVNANRLDLHATLKKINPDFIPPPDEEEDSSTTFFYNGIERYYHFLMKLISGFLENNMVIGPKLLFLLCLVSPYDTLFIPLFLWVVLPIVCLRIIFLTLHGLGFSKEMRMVWDVGVNLCLKWAIKKSLVKHFWPKPPKRPKEKAKEEKAKTTTTLKESATEEEKE